jgi:hypothetical protein
MAVAAKMSAEGQRSNSRMQKIGSFLNAIVVFASLFSGIAAVFIGKLAGLSSAPLILLAIGLGVELAATLLIGLYLRFRLLRTAPRRAS